MLAVDDLVRSLLDAHFGDGEERLEAYLDATGRFALDTLPRCPERAARLADDDPRKPFADSHRMAGDVMWFAWAVHLECAQLLEPGPPAEEARALLMAGVALGCSTDFAFSGRCRTRREYGTRDEAARRRIRERGRECARDFETAAAEVRDLFSIRRFGDE